MTIDKIEYSESQEYINEMGLKKWKKLNVYATLSPGEDHISAGVQLKKAHAETFSAMNPGTNINLTPEPYNQPPPVINRKIVEKLEIDIDNSQTPEELEYYKMEAIKHGLYTHWSNKLDELQNKQQ